MAASVPSNPVVSPLDTSMLHCAVRHLVEGMIEVSGDISLLNGWLKEAAARGIHPDDMAMALHSVGRRPDVGAFLAHLAHAGFYVVKGGEGALDPRLVPRSLQGSPEVAHAREHLVDLGDRTVRRVMSVGSPDVAIYENFLSDEECEFIKSIVDGKMARSSVVGRGFSNVTSDVRRSYGAFLYVGSHPVVGAIESRVARLTGLPVGHGEGLQVLHYEHSDEYQPHFDFFEPGTPDEHRLMEASGNRVGTLIFYLNDVEEGGATYFPRLDLAVHPKKGSALWFSYLAPDGVLDQRTEHAGLPILRGTKWIATKWLRERPYDQVRPEGSDMVVAPPPPAQAPFAATVVPTPLLAGGLPMAQAPVSPGQSPGHDHPVPIQPVAGVGHIGVPPSDSANDPSAS